MSSAGLPSTEHLKPKVQSTEYKVQKTTTPLLTSLIQEEKSHIVVLRHGIPLELAPVLNIPGQKDEA